jgi:ubiquinone/menaquinone biosynthesis C-methylase UbiE
MDEEQIRTAVRERYARAATAGRSCCGETPAIGPEAASCCTDAPLAYLGSRVIPDDLATASLGCGAPIEAAALCVGETVVDLGSGAGLDVFLAADRVGPTGRAIGVDMTPEMVAKARQNAARLGMPNVEFRLGEIEHLPLPDGIADVVISNCVINLVPDKRPAFAEAFRVLKPGGRLVVSDIVSDRPLPGWFRTVERWTSCLAGAIPERDYLAMLTAAGFQDIEVVSKHTYMQEHDETVLFSITVRATKPTAA